MSKWRVTTDWSGGRNEHMAQSPNRRKFNTGVPLLNISGNFMLLTMLKSGLCIRVTWRERYRKDGAVQWQIWDTILSKEQVSEMLRQRSEWLVMAWIVASSNQYTWPSSDFWPSSISMSRRHDPLRSIHWWIQLRGQVPLISSDVQRVGVANATFRKTGQVLETNHSKLLLGCTFPSPLRDSVSTISLPCSKIADKISGGKANIPAEEWRSSGPSSSWHKHGWSMINAPCATKRFAHSFADVHICSGFWWSQDVHDGAPFISQCHISSEGLQLPKNFESRCSSPRVYFFSLHYGFRARGSMCWHSSKSADDLILQTPQGFWESTSESGYHWSFKC